MSVPDTLPLFPLGSSLMPGMDLSLQVFEDRYRQLLIDQNGADPLFGVVMIRAGREVVDQPEIREIGTAASLIAETPHLDGRTSIVVRGNRRFRVESQDWSRGYLTGTVTWLDEPTGDEDSCLALASQATDLWTKLIQRLARMISQQREVNELIDTLIRRLPADPTARCYDILGQLPIPAGTRQLHLELPTTEARLASLVELLTREIRLASAFRTAPSLTYASNRPMNPN